jgi:hypothetical protein
MKLKRLLIEREYYGENKGKLTAKITVDDDKSEISLLLTPDASLRMVQCCLDELVHATELGAAELKNRLLSLTSNLLA